MKYSKSNGLKSIYFNCNFFKKIYYVITNNDRVKFYKYIKLCYKSNNCRNILLRSLIMRRKNTLGQKMNLDIQSDSIGINLKIYHSNVVVNKNSVIGNNCAFHGNNCVGNKAISNECPIIKDNVDIGFGSVLIGPIVIGSNTIIGANSVVNKSFPDGNVIIAGNPAKIIKTLNDKENR